MKTPIRILSDFVPAAARVAAGGLAPVAPTTDALEAKRAAALAWLGDAWLLHPKHAPRRCPPPLSRLARRSRVFA